MMSACPVCPRRSAVPSASGPADQRARRAIEGHEGVRDVVDRVLRSTRPRQRRPRRGRCRPWSRSGKRAATVPNGTLVFDPVSAPPLAVMNAGLRDVAGSSCRATVTIRSPDASPSADRERTRASSGPAIAITGRAGSERPRDRPPQERWPPRRSPCRRHRRIREGRRRRGRARRSRARARGRRPTRRGRRRPS